MPSTKTYDKYKDSGVEWIGEIPVYWQIDKFSRIFNRITDYVASGSFADIDANVQYLDEPDYAMLVRTADLSGTKDKRVYINKHAYNYLSNSNLFGGELILSNIGSVGNVYIYEPMYEHSSLAPNAIMLDGSKNNKFIYYWLINPLVNDELKKIGGNAVQLKFNKTQLRQFKAVCPPDKEQEQITDYLDKKCGEIDRVVDTQKDIIEKLKEYKQSVITEAVTKGLDKSVPLKASGIEWIGEIPQHWEVCKLLKIFKNKKSPNANNIETNVLSLSYGNIKKRNIKNNMGLLPETFETYNIIEPNDIVLRLTDLQNDHKSLRCGLVKEKGIITSAYVTLELKDKTQCANYFYRLLHTFDIMKGFYGMGAGVRQSLKFDGELCNLYIIKPTKGEQSIIAEYLDKKCAEIDNAIKDKEQLIEKLTEYKKSLIYECVTGKRKVIE